MGRHLLLSLLLVIVMYPVLDHGDLRRLFLGLLMFAAVILSTVRMARSKGWIVPSVLLMSVSLALGVAETIAPSRLLGGMKWGTLTGFFGLSVAGLFTYLKNARAVTNAHLSTAISIYLLLGLQWFALYNTIDIFDPGSFVHRTSVPTGRQTELLYFSLVTLSTIGYGDIVPLHDEVRILAALEGITGVLYVAITVALLVSAYKAKSDSS